MKIIVTVIGILCGIAVVLFDSGLSNAPNTVRRKGMEVSWTHRNNRVHFEMKAPTIGWVAIGFNEGDQLKNTYLIMGRVANNLATVKEHFVVEPGDYRPIETFGAPVLVDAIEGMENEEGTVIRFSLPVEAIDAYCKNLEPGTHYTLLMAFSLEDDFQHHSVMRTQTTIQL
ncbi:DOMON domain-containing protein [uncultured Imperialibacter sp.]|uniref:DOMON domain-containing protein n=1 Tax=uncultured Imperialibacter sp. TaxID=1672639 RepID=UPI0030DA2DC9|tara:strand:- start:10024 stop:10536 length:513 start_codon:yes stop_codon:yes gene_type:complete